MSNATVVADDIEGLVKEAEILIERRDTGSLSIAEMLMSNANSTGNVRNMAMANYVMAYYNCLVVNDYGKAKQICEKILKDTNATHLIGIDHKIYMTLGNIYQLKGELYSSQLWYLKGLKLLEAKGSLDNSEKTSLATFYYNLSFLFINTDTEINGSAEEYLQKAIAFYEETGSDFKLSKCYSAYANILEGKKDFEKAIEYMYKALELDMPGNENYSIALSKANLGILHSHINMYDRAIEHLQQALGYFDGSEMMHETALVKFYLGKVLCQARQRDKGLELLVAAEQMFVFMDNKHELTNVYQLLSEVASEAGDFKAGLEYHQKYVKNLKHVYDGEKANALARAKQEFDTEQKEKEAVLLRQKNEEIRVYAATLETANRDLETLSYSISHDLKAPLAMIKNINAMTSDDEHGYHKFIDETCKVTLASINDLLSFSRSVSKNNPGITGYETEEVYHLVAAKVNELEPGAYANGQSISFIQNDKTLLSRINRESIGRAIANIVENSIKFSKPQSQISINVYSEEKQWVVIQISDTGIGIPEEMKQHIFKKFSAAQREGLKGEKSTGLGLYIAHSIVQLHGGYIEFESNVGEGSTFIIRLPLA